MIRLLTFMVALSTTVRAVNTIEREFHCPIDDSKFTQRIETSAQPVGVRLDLKRLGDVMEPTTLPQCPKCHFVIFTEKWTDELVARLKPFVLGPDYRLVASKSTSYFCLAQIQRFLKAPEIYTAHSYLRASWQVEDKEGPRDRCLSLALEHFTAALDGMKPDDGEYVNTALLCGEIERRLKKWDAAAARFAKFRGDPAITRKFQRAVIEQEIELIGRRDSAPHPATGQSGKSVDPEQPPAVPQGGSESPVPASLKEASAAGAESFASRNASHFPDLPPVSAVVADDIEDVPELPDLDGIEAREEPVLLPEPRILKPALEEKPPKRRVAKRKPENVAKPAVVALPDGRKKRSRLIGLK